MQMRSLKSAVFNKFAAQVASKNNLPNLTVKDQKILAEILVCDDWGTAISMAAPLIDKYGSSVVNWVKDKFSKKDQSVPFQGAGSQFKETYKLSIPSVTLDYRLDGVCVDAVKAFLVPSDYLCQRPTLKSPTTSTFKSTRDYSLTTGTDGIGILHIYP